MPVIASNDPEFGNISPTIPDQKRQKISRLLRDRPDTAATQLHQLGIRRILLVKEQDYGNYEWLGSKSGIQLLEQNDRLILYTVEDTR